VNGEHLFPDWLRDILPSSEPGVYFRQIGKDPTDRHEWTKKPFTEKTHFVCERCNGGWMSDLESASKPVLSKPIRHEPTALSPVAQMTAATWAFKTCLVFSGSMGSDPVVPLAHFRHLRAWAPPPQQVSVWIGSHARVRQDATSSVFIQRPLSLRPMDDKLGPDDAFGYLFFLAIGGLSFLVVGHRYLNRTEVTYEGSFDEAIDQIWPEPSGNLVWPPRLMMDQELIDLIAMPPGGFSALIWP
jgi:hypothetical protein